MTSSPRVDPRDEPGDAVAKGELRNEVEIVLATLSQREQAVIRLRFGLDDGRQRTLDEVGREFGLSRERIRQIEKVTLLKLRDPARAAAPGGVRLLSRDGSVQAPGGSPGACTVSYGEASYRCGRVGGMNWTLEVVVVPVSDVDRAKEFYADRLGFTVDHDTRIGADVRIVQLTPPGSGCSVVIGTGCGARHAARARSGGSSSSCRTWSGPTPELLDSGRTGQRDPGGRRRTPARCRDPLDNVGFLHFTDPDGNGWAVQQISDRA